MYLKKNRKLNRLRGFDYSFPGHYFITICTQGRMPMLGDVVDYEMKLNDLGKIVKQQLFWLHKHFPHVRLDEWVIMPNHIHIILEINYNFDDNKTGYTDTPVGTGRDLSLQNKPLPEIIGAFKTTSSKLIHQIGHEDFAWQRSYHDRIIRNEKELSNKRDYIIGNPAKWAEDRNNPINIKK
jgi:REP element-mobilizing transposase RayT